LFFRPLLWASAWLFLVRFSPEEVKKASPFLGLNGLCSKWCPVIVSFRTDVGFHRFDVGCFFPNFYWARYNLCRFFVRGSRLGAYNAISEID